MSIGDRIKNKSSDNMWHSHDRNVFIRDSSLLDTTIKLLPKTHVVVINSFAGINFAFCHTVNNHSLAFIYIFSFLSHIMFRIITMFACIISMFACCIISMFYCSPYTCSNNL